MLIPQPRLSTTRARHARTTIPPAIGVGCLLALSAGCSTASTGGAVNPPLDGATSQGPSQSGTSGATSGSPGGSGESRAGAGAPAVGSDSGAQGADATTTTQPAIDGSSTETVPEGGPPTVVTCPTTALQPGDSNASIQVGGVMRNYILHVGTGYTGKTPVPLIVDYHPILENDSFERGNSGYAAVADIESFVVVFPDGMPATGMGAAGSSISNAWNIGPCCTPSRMVDDEGFSRALIQKIETQACIDPKRVYAVGYSMGGGMAHYVGCNMADVYAAVAPAAFDLLQDSEEPCHPSRPITEICFRGTADPIVPYAGGASNPPNGLPITIHFLGAQGTFQKWSQLDGCTGSPSAVDANGCSTYSQCKDGVEVTLCTTQGGGHVTGNPQIGWPMLKKHPMP